jgi:hypothetical protein
MTTIELYQGASGYGLAGMASRGSGGRGMSSQFRFKGGAA